MAKRRTASTGSIKWSGTNIVRSARDFSLDLIFPTLARVFDKKTVFGDKLKHVIEPRATYRYVTGIGTDFNRFIRFDESDLLSNTNELELSLTNRLYAKRGDNVQEIFTWELMQKRYFDPTFGGALHSGQPQRFRGHGGSRPAYAFLVGPRSSSPVVSTSSARIRSAGSACSGRPITTRSSRRWWTATSRPIIAGRSTSSAPGTTRSTTNPTLLSPSANQFTGRVDYGDANRRGWNAGSMRCTTTGRAACFTRPRR